MTTPLVNGTYDLPLPQSRRRALVAIQHACSLPPLVLAVSGLLFNHWAWAIVALALLAASTVIHTRLAMSIQNVTQANPARMDERQRSTRDRAFVLTLHFLSWVLTVAWVYAMTAGLTGWWLPEGRSLGFGLWGVAMLTYGLPTSIAAWIEADQFDGA